jgi:hypothetical protein
MDDASKLGPLWVSQLRKEVASRRNRAAENLLTINPDGDFAKQHRMLIEAADAMLEAQGLLAALRKIAAGDYAQADVVAQEALEAAGLA